MARTTEGFLYTPSKRIRGLTTSAVIESSTYIQESYDVVVIGTGFAGLIAARNVSRATDLKVLIVEGRDRIGGRTWTAQAWGEEFEMGGTWVHWNQPFFYVEAHRYGLHKYLKTSSGTYGLEELLYKPVGAPLRRLEVAELDATLERVTEKFFTVDGMTARQLMPYPHDLFHQPSQPWMRYDDWSIQERLDDLDATVEEKNLLKAHFNSIACVNGKLTAFTEALRWYALGGYSMQGMYETVGTFKLGKGGMTSLARSILSDYKGDVLMRATIKKISQDMDSVTLATTTGRYVRARCVICTIPLNCLSDIIFDPPLNSLRQKAISMGHPNKGTKIHFSLAETQPGWFSNTNDSIANDFIFAFSDHNGTHLSAQNGTFAIGFGYSNKLHDPQDSTRIISEFKKLKPDVTVRGYLTHDWMNDPLAKGTWYGGGPGTTTKYLQELQRAHGRVLMASADWADGWRGFIDGAIEQGTKAAVDVVTMMEQLRKAVAKL